MLPNTNYKFVVAAENGVSGEAKEEPQVGQILLLLVLLLMVLHLIVLLLLLLLPPPPGC